jgi:glutamate synthase (NADPH/NADH) large chain
MYAIAVVFTRNASQLVELERICVQNDLKVVLDRVVPIDTNALGEQALQSLPEIHHLFITPNSLMASQRFDALLYLSRKETEHKFVLDQDFYIASMSTRVISYKGLIMPTHIKEFYTEF